MLPPRLGHRPSRRAKDTALARRSAQAGAASASARARRDALPGIDSQPLLPFLQTRRDPQISLTNLTLHIPPPDLFQQRWPERVLYEQSNFDTWYGGVPRR